MLSNNRDLYATVEALIRKLNDAGEYHWSSALEDGLSISTLPGEILGETRLQLKKLRTTQVPINLGSESEFVEAISYLNKILGP